MILGLVMDGTVDRVRQRFGIGRACVVADRGMISAGDHCRARGAGLDYVPGACEHADKLVRQIVLDDQTPFVPLPIDRQQGETRLFVKKVKRGFGRYIVCRNEREVANCRAVPEAIVAALDAQLRAATVGNAGCPRYLGKANAARVSRPSRSTPASWPRRRALTVSSYCVPTHGSCHCKRCCATRLGAVEDLFRRAKAVMRTRPIFFHSCSAAICGHVFCPFLALLLQKRLDDLAQSADVTLEWKTLLRHLDRCSSCAFCHREADWLRPHRRRADPRCGIPRRQDRPAPARQADRPAAPQTRPKRCGRLRRSATAARIPAEAA
jgi:hypothetical protein